jgi:hypothetical protein
MRGWAVVAACLAVVCGLTAWVWRGEHEAHQVTRVELVKAQVRLSAQVPPDPAAAQTAARPAAPWPADGGAADSARLVIE